MKKTTILLSAIAGLFCLMLFFPTLAKAQGDIKLTRDIEPLVVTPGSTVTVYFTLSKGFGGGVARLDEYIPSGFTAVVGANEGSRFYVTDSTATFAWMNMPFDSVIALSYHLTIPATALGKYTLVAQFVYATTGGVFKTYLNRYNLVVQKPVPIITPIVKTTRQKQKPIAAKAKPPVKPKPLVIKDTAKHITKVVANNVQSPPKKQTPHTPVTIAKPKTSPPAKHINSPVVMRPKAASPPTHSTPIVANNPAPDGLFYRVQIMASALRLNVDSVVINGIRDKLYIVTTRGISRYSIGAFHDLKAAIDYSAKINENGLKGAFVVAYKDGSKITIKESLTLASN